MADETDYTVTLEVHERTWLLGVAQWLANLMCWCLEHVYVCKDDVLRGPFGKWEVAINQVQGNKDN